MAERPSPFPSIPGLADTLLRLVGEYVYVQRLEPDGRQVTEWSNQPFERVTGFARADVDARGGWLTLIHPDDRDEARRMMSVASSGAPSWADLRFLPSSGETRLLHIRLEPVRDEAGRVTHVCGAVRDITDRLEASAAIESRERLLREVLDALPIAVWTVGLNGFVQEVNAAGRRMRGDGPVMPPEPYWAFNEALAGGQAAAALGNDAIARVLASGAPTIDREVEVTGPDGAARSLLSSVLPMHDASGGISGAICLNADITERRALEVRLHQSLRMDSIGRMAGGIAHDFNNLLTIIIGCAEMALKFDSAGSSATEWQETLAAARRAAALTSQLLAFARQQPVTPRIVDLGAVVAQMGGLVRRIIGPTIALEMPPAEAVLPVNIDPGQFEQILLNLALNARDAMPSGGTLTVEARRETVTGREARQHAGQTPGEKARLSVTDTGVGIPAEIRARIFEPFFTTKGTGGGTGLGLAMCYGIVKQAGGYIGLDSTVGKGSTFWIDLPLAHGEITIEAAPQAFASVPASARILLVEDERAVVNVARRALEIGGYSVTVAYGGAEALEVLAAMDTPPDLLVTDIMMPGMRGTALVKAVWERLPDLRVLFMSGYPGPIEPEFASARILAKPFRPADLLRHVAETLRA